MIEIGGSLLEAAIKINGTGYRGSVLRCTCGDKQKFVNYRSKTITSLLKQVTITRAYYHCYKCGKSSVPLDEKLDIEKTFFSPGVRESVCFLGAEMSFERSSEILKDLTGISVSKQRIEHIAEQMGSAIEKQQKTEEERMWRGLDDQKNKEGRKEIEYLYISADGTCVNTEESWKEVKSGVIFEARRTADGPVRGKTTYIGSFDNSETFGRRLYLEARKNGLENSKEVIMIGDGAKWIWNEAGTNFPGSIEIVDWYHAAEKLWDLGRQIYPDHEKKLKSWIKSRLKHLRLGAIEKLKYSLNKCRAPSKVIKENIKQIIEYYDKNKERMRYRKFRRNGYFIGSGVVEGSCKHVIGERLKKSGMRWSVEGGNNILQLRICLLNKRWNHFWKEHKNFL